MSDARVAPTETADEMRHRLSEVMERFTSAIERSEMPWRGAESTITSVITPLLQSVVPLLSDWCRVDLLGDEGELQRVAVRSNLPRSDDRFDDDDDVELRARVPHIEEIVARVHVEGGTEVWPLGAAAPCCVVVGLRVHSRRLGTVTLVVSEERPGFSPMEQEAVEQLAREVARSLERAELRREARESVRRSQHIASQLHQLIAASLTVNTLNDDRDIATSVAISARTVFGADHAFLSLEGDREQPLRVLVGKGRNPGIPLDDDLDNIDLPPLRSAMTGPWRDGGWLVAPLLERRTRGRGLLALKRDGGPPFSDEDVEVLTLLVQTANTALSGAEMTRTIHNSEARWRALVETAPAGIVEVDADFRVTWWNLAASTIFAWPEHADERAHAGPELPEDVNRAFRALWSDALRGEAGAEREFLEVSIGERRRDLSASAVLLPAHDGTRGILTLVTDVTNQRQMASENRFAHQMEIRGQVASNLAHDFNNLLTLISGYAEMLAKSLDSDETSMSMIEEIQSTAARASSLTGQLLSIGRTKPTEPVVVDPVAAMTSIGDVLERIMGVDIHIVWNLSPAAGSILIDADQFEQMLLNLALNARDAMTDGGELRITVSRLERTDDVTWDEIPEGEYVHISVADTGHGMDEETRQRCFEPMFTTKGPFKGSGLGLSAAHRLIEESRGVIRCSSVLGQGTTFDICIPAVSSNVIEESSTKPPPQSRESTTILVVDDDDKLRQLMAQVLRRDGYQVLAASSGQQALDLARNFDGEIDLLLSDVVMPEMSGREVATQLLQDRSDLRVLLISGSEDESVVQGLGASQAAFLAKPFRPSELIERIARLLETNENV